MPLTCFASADFAQPSSLATRTLVSTFAAKTLAPTPSTLASATWTSSSRGSRVTSWSASTVSLSISTTHLNLDLDSNFDCCAERGVSLTVLWLRGDLFVEFVLKRTFHAYLHPVSLKWVVFSHKLVTAVQPRGLTNKVDVFVNALNALML